MMAGAGRRRTWLARIAAAAVAAYALYFTWACVAIVEQAGREEAQRADTIVVFGAAEYRGRPSPVYRAGWTMPSSSTS